MSGVALTEARIEALKPRNRSRYPRYLVVNTLRGQEFSTLEVWFRAKSLFSNT